MNNSITMMIIINKKNHINLIITIHIQMVNLIIINKTHIMNNK